LTWHAATVKISVLPIRGRSDQTPTASVADVGLPRRLAVPSLIEQVEEQIRQATHGCIRDLVVREELGRILVRGQTPTQYARQLALGGALEFVSGERLRAEITVG
jgi:hypothetical protein